MFESSKFQDRTVVVLAVHKFVKKKTHSVDTHTLVTEHTHTQKKQYTTILQKHNNPQLDQPKYGNVKAILQNAACT